MEKWLDTYVKDAAPPVAREPKKAKGKKTKKKQQPKGKVDADGGHVVFQHTVTTSTTSAASGPTRPACA